MFKRVIIIISTILMLLSFGCAGNNTNNIADNTAIQDTSASVHSNIINYKLRIIIEKASIKSDPQESSDTLFDASKGYVFDVIKEQKQDKYSWFKIQYAEDQTGWLHSSHCSKITESNNLNFRNRYISLELPEGTTVYKSPSVSEILDNKFENGLYEIFDTQIDDKMQIWYKIYHSEKNIMCWILKGDHEELFSSIKTSFKDSFIIDFQDEKLEAYVKVQLNISDRAITYKDVKDIDTFHIYGPLAEDISNLYGIGFFDNLKILGLYDSKKTTLYPINRLKSLETLLIKKTDVQDFENLSWLPNITAFTLISTNHFDLEKLNYNNKIEFLDIENSNISHLNGIERLSQLKTLVIRDNSIDNILPIKNLSNLVSLRISNTKIDDLSPIKELSNLETLYINNCDIRNMITFSANNNIKALNLDENHIYNLDFIDGLTKLEHLSLQENNITTVKKLTNLFKLDTLDLANNEIIEISSIGTLKNLTELSLSNNQIYDISSLKSLTKLIRFEIYNNNIEDISPLYHLGLKGQYYKGNPAEEIIKNSEAVVLDPVVQSEILDTLGIYEDIVITQKMLEQIYTLNMF